jgi:peptidoglycan/xylan/chitin deacetylase (PgdA/CDA1 family)
MWSIKPLLRNSDVRRAVISGGLEASSLLQSLGIKRDAGGLGAIFTLHHVRPHRQNTFDPNRHLDITPEFLDEAMHRLQHLGFIFTTLDSLPGRLDPGRRDSPRLAAFTLDDGYRDNLEHALPVFARHCAPFTVFATKGFSERSHGIWWETLAELLRRVDGLDFDFGAGEERLDLRSPRRKRQAFARFAALVHGDDEAWTIARIDAAARRHGIEPLDIVQNLVMDRAELKALAAHPLASLGAHTVSHRALARLTDAEAIDEMGASADYVAAITGRRPSTLAFPYGTSVAATQREAALAADCGFSVAVTTRPGVLMPALSAHMTMLPRLSFNGYYQRPRYVSALASGIPLTLMRQK